MARSLIGRLRHTVGARGFEERIVWLLGSPRSGSTWLTQMFAEHPAVVAVDEPLIGAYLGPFLADIPGVDGAALTTDTFTVRRIQAGNRNQFFAEEFAGVWAPALGRMIRDRLRAHALRYPPAAGASGALVVVKEPNGSQSADLLLRALPRSRLLFLLRDGRDVVDSETAGSGAGGWVAQGYPGYSGIAAQDRLEFVVRSARKWLWRIEVVEAAYAAHRGPKLLLRYEDLLADPVARVRDVLAWLGAPLDDEQLHGIVERRAFDRVPPEARGPQQFFRAAAPGQWRENLTAAEQNAVHAVLAPKLSALGYEVSRGLD